MPTITANINLEKNLAERIESGHCFDSNAGQSTYLQIMSLTDALTDPISLTVNHQDLRKIIEYKDKQIQILTSALKLTSSQLQAKTIQAQQLKLQIQLKAQLKNQNISLKGQNSILKQKLALFQQVNCRQYQQTNDLEKQKSLLSQKISQLEQRLKFEVSSRQIKGSYMRAQISEEKRKNTKLQKEVVILKAILRQLQENQDQQQDQQILKDQYCEKYNKKASNKQKVYERPQTIYPKHCDSRHNFSNQQNIKQVLSKNNQCILTQNYTSNQYWNQSITQDSNNQINLQEQIIFM